MLRKIIHNRNKYFDQTTIGDLSINNRHFCYTLEDTVRPKDIKVKGFTAIPANSRGYNISIRYSNKFKRNVLVLFTEDDNTTIIWNGVEFTYVYSHGGNKHEDTEGCILVAYNVDGDTIFGTAELNLFEKVQTWIQNGDTVKWYIYNNKQSE